MNPVDFCLIFPIVFIFLKLFWTEYDNVTSGNNCFVINSIKMKMSASGCNIYNLKINTSSWAIGWHLWVLRQTIDSAATDNQWSAFILKIHM